jgi:peptide deformylase
MKIVHTPHAVLLKKAEPVEKITKEIREIIAQMKATLQKSDIGIGLAAPQIGVSLQIFLASPQLQSSKEKTAPIYTFINPKILSQSPVVKNHDDKSLEGCLSIPDIWGPVARSMSVQVSYQDETGKQITKTFKGSMAIIIQHEVDHLNGTLFTHRVIDQNETLYKMNADSGKLERIEL